MDCVSVLSGHTQDVKFVRFNPTNNNLYSCSYDDTVKVWLYAGEDFSNINTLRAHEGTVWGIAFKPTQQTLTTKNMDVEENEEKHVGGIGLDDEDVLDDIEVPTDTLLSTEFVTCGMDGRVIYWEEKEGLSGQYTLLLDNIGNSEETHKIILSDCNNDEPFIQLTGMRRESLWLEETIQCIS